MKIKNAKFYRYKISGMHCASCAQLITNRLKKLPGLQQVSASYATEQLSFKAESVNVGMLEHELSELGYGLIEESSQEKENDKTSHHSNHGTIAEDKHDWQILLPIAGFTFVVMFAELLSNRFWWIPALPWPMAWLQFFWWLAASFALALPGHQFVTAIGRFVKKRVANMDTLVGFGTLTAYVYSTMGMFFPQTFARIGLPTDSYFDVTIVVIAFVLLGKHLESLAKTKTGEALQALTKLQAKSAIVIRNGVEESASVSEVQIGELVKIKAGETIPLDGIVIDGSSSVDESLLTGESLPVLKSAGQVVLGGSLNQEGVLIVKTTKTGESGFLHQVIELVLSAQASKAPIERLADQISAWFVPAVLLLATASFIGWIGYGFSIHNLNISLAIHALVGVLVIACPCALGLATPTAMIVSMGRAASQGILIKDAATIEQLSKVNTLVLDKTGTLTVGKPKLQQTLLADKSHSETEVLRLASGLESGSTHPLAHALMDEIKAKRLTEHRFTNLKHLTGIGVTGSFQKKEFWIGGESMLKKQQARPFKHERPLVDANASEMLLYLGSGKQVLAKFILADVLKSNAIEEIKRIKQQGLEVSLLSGDREQTAQSIAALVGIDTVRAQVTPAEKLAFIAKLRQQGKIVAMVGDGVNDAPALAQADVGIAMSTGSDSALATAGLTLLHGDLHKLGQAVVLARNTMIVVKQNLFWAFAYNVIGIPLAAGWLYPFFGILLNPAFAGVAMALSSASVVGNSLRLKNMKIL